MCQTSKQTHWSSESAVQWQLSSTSAAFNVHNDSLKTAEGQASSLDLELTSVSVIDVIADIHGVSQLTYVKN